MVGELYSVRLIGTWLFHFYLAFYLNSLVALAQWAEGLQHKRWANIAYAPQKSYWGQLSKVDVWLHDQFDSFVASSANPLLTNGADYAPKLTICPR